MFFHAIIEPQTVMSHSPQVKKKAVALRRKGMSIPAIARTLGVAKSTVSLWARNIQLPHALSDRLKKNFASANEKGRAVQKARRDIDREQTTNALHIDLKTLHYTPTMWRLTAALLYWCEGGKQNPSGGIRFTNSDPQLIRAFLHALRMGFHLDSEKFRVLMHIHGYHDDRVQRIFWSQVTGIAESKFQKSYRKANTGKRKRKGYQGCIDIRYYDARIVRNLIILYSLFAKSIVGA